MHPPAQGLLSLEKLQAERYQKLSVAFAAAHCSGSVSASGTQSQSSAGSTALTALDFPEARLLKLVASVQQFIHFPQWHPNRNCR